ncbi:MAG: hypothetical protein AAGE43_04390 [Pseudomonadota bacterium]
MITFEAPGKAVIWGEYAVLAGAPALVMAVNRYAECRIDVTGNHWALQSSGFNAHTELSLEELLASPSTGGLTGLVKAIFEAYGNPPAPDGVVVNTDTSTFHADGNKLGIGSSAAICTASCAAFAELFGETFTERRALAAHQSLQGKAGSGLDVAAACHGGLIRFQKGESAQVDWPRTLHYQFLWAGHSTSTVNHVAAFNRWRADGTPAPLASLCTASEALFEELSFERLEAYVDALRRMDQEAGLGIFGPVHEGLFGLAVDAQVVYKPCGAGGGDIGIAVSDNPTALDEFLTLAHRHSVQPLDLEIAAHGVHRIGP